LFGGLAASFLLDDVSAGSLVDRTTFPKGSDKNSDKVGELDWTSGNVPAKDDITNAYAYTKKNAAGELILYVGVEREDASGDSHVDVEFFQKSVGLNDQDKDTGKCSLLPKSCTFSGSNKDGDVLVNMDFSKGGGFGTLTVRTRQESLKDHYTDPLAALNNEGCNSADTVCAVNNGVDINTSTWIHRDNHGDPITLIPPNGFTEFGINVQKLTGKTNLCFASFMVKTRSSQSFTAELKDFQVVPFEKCEATVATEIHEGSAGGPTHTAKDIQKGVGVGEVASGTTVHDKAIVKGTVGAGTPLGDVTFSRFNNSNCAAPAAFTETKALVETAAETATTPGVSAQESSDYLTVGTTPEISFQAHYAGSADKTYPAADSPCEKLSVKQGKVTVTTDIQLADGTSVLNTAINSGGTGTTVHDVATAQGSLKDSGGKLIDPTGKVTFTLFSTANCTGTSTTETIDLAGGTANDGKATAKSSETTPNLATGDFLTYTAVYLGDDNYEKSTISACEPICAFPFLK
jgi:hypothetical protein